MSGAEDVPFETTSEGEYLVIEPTEGIEPENMEVTVSGTTYHVEGLVGKDVTSNVFPEVLCYKHCWVVEDEE